jgi:hypothetical protein
VVLAAAVVSRPGFAYPYQAESHAPEAKRTDIQQRTSQKSEQGAPNILNEDRHPQEGREDAATNTTDAQDKSQPKPKWIISSQYAMVILTAIYVLLTGVYAGVSIFTLRAIKRQVGIAERAATAAETNALAAKASADALAKSERAWIVVEKLDPPTTLTPPATGELWTTVVAFTFKNCGKTVARIRDAKTRFHVVSVAKSLLEIPDYGSGQRSREIPDAGMVLAPNHTFQIAVPLETRALSQEEAQEIRRGTLSLYVYGLIKYLDFADAPRESQFCYVWDVPRGFVLVGIDKEGFRLGGPQAYNNYT